MRITLTVSDRLSREVESYADRMGITRNEAIKFMITQFLSSEQVRTLQNRVLERDLSDPEDENERYYQEWLKQHPEEHPDYPYNDPSYQEYIKTLPDDHPDKAKVQDFLS